jgi:hypothetical protein
LVERDLPKVDVASSNLVIRSRTLSRSERDTAPIVDVASSNLVIRSRTLSRSERDTAPIVDVASSNRSERPLRAEREAKCREG